LFDDYNYKLINEVIFRLKPEDFSTFTDSKSFTSHRSFKSLMSVQDGEKIDLGAEGAEGAEG
jgi:hypothetical protein